LFLERGRRERERERRAQGRERKKQKEHSLTLSSLFPLLPLSLFSLPSSPPLSLLSLSLSSLALSSLSLPLNSWAKYLREGTEVQLVTWNGKVISVDPPTTVELEVTSTDPGVKGNTVSGGSKPATLETGAVVQVPLFVNAGEKVKVDTRTDQYLSRAATSSF
jgi:hypothetical protein